MKYHLVRLLVAEPPSSEQPPRHLKPLNFDGICQTSAYEHLTRVKRLLKVFSNDFSFDISFITTHLFKLARDLTAAREFRKSGASGPLPFFFVEKLI